VCTFSVTQSSSFFQRKDYQQQMDIPCQKAAHPAPVLFVCPNSVDEGKLRCIPQTMEVQEKGCVRHQVKKKQKGSAGISYNLIL
jgi:hypothetical protein